MRIERGEVRGVGGSTGCLEWGLVEASAGGAEKYRVQT